MATTDGNSASDGGGEGNDVVGDAPRYLDTTTAGTGPPSRNGAWLVAAGMVVVVAVVIALVAVTRSPADDTATPTSTTTPAPGEELDDATQEISAAAPYDGKASMRLPITVTPNRDLVDGQMVTVSGTGFPPGADIGVIMCTNDAVFDGIGACDIGTAMSSISMTNEKITADADGSFSVQYQVRFHFSVADPNGQVAPPPSTVIGPNGSGNVIYSSSSSAMRQIDCGAGDIDPDVWPTVIPPTAESDPGGFTCIIAAGMVTDYDKSGGAAIGAAGSQFRTFEPSETHARPTVAPPVVTEASTTTSLVGQLPTTTAPAPTAPGATSTTVAGPAPAPPGSTPTTRPQK